jgi:hypothetical protein
MVMMKGVEKWKTRRSKLKKRDENWRKSLVENAGK